MVSTSTFLLLIFVATANILSASSFSVEPTTAQKITSRWLAKKSTPTINDVYNNHATQESNTFMNVSLGLIAGISMLLGFLFITDRDTFKQITGVKKLPHYCKCSCRKPSIDDSLEPTPFEEDNYNLTKETPDDLAQEDEEDESPKRRPHSVFLWFRARAKEYGDSDKYNIPWPRSEGEEGETSILNPVMALWEDIRLRFCWKPTKKYSQEDKYAVDGGKVAADEDEIPYAASSYESPEPGTTPW